MASASNTSKTNKQSFFKDYYRYKLRSLKGFNITFLVMNMIITVVFALVVLITCTALKNYDTDANNAYYYYSIFSYYMMGILLLIFIAENVLIMIMAAVNMKFCHNRSAIDTIGGLPLTVEQRFFGDFLSGLSSFAPTFFIGCIPSLIMMAVIQFGISPEYRAAMTALGRSRIYLAEPFEDKFVLIGLLAIAMMFICLAASYTIACFVTSCSGKLNTSIIFTFITVIVLPIILIFYGGFILNNATGVIDDEYFFIIDTLPPVGTIALLVVSFFHNLWGDYEFPVTSPGVIVMLAVVILPAVGAYLITKKRKAEAVDKPFINKALYMAATFVISITVCGMMLYAFEVPAFVLIVLTFTVAACIWIEYAGSHSGRTFWKGLVRFAVSAAVCGIFAGIVYGTHSFNIGKKLPDEGKVEFVMVNGSYLRRQGYYPELNHDRSVISIVLSEHQKIIDELDEFTRVQNSYDYNSILIRYYLRDGSSVVREYTARNEKTDKLITDFCDTLLKMPEVYNKTTLGMLDLPCDSISYRDNGETDAPMHVIKASVQNELIECLKTDMLNRPKNYNNYATRYSRYIYYSYRDGSGKAKEQVIEIFDIDKNTLEFLSNTDNFSTEISVSIDDNAHYAVYYYTDGLVYTDGPKDKLDYTIYIEFEADTPAKRELISYFETEYTAADNLSNKFYIEAGGKRLKVKPENEQAALTAMIKLIKEQVSGGNIS